MENPPLPKVRGPTCKLSADAKDALEKLAKKKGSNRWTKETLNAFWRKFKHATGCNISKKSFACKIQRLASAGDNSHFRWTSEHQDWINKHHKVKCHEKLWQEFQTVFTGPKQPSKRAFQNRMLDSSKQTVRKKPFSIV